MNIPEAWPGYIGLALFIGFIILTWKTGSYK